MFAGGERLTSIELERGRFLLLKLKSKTRKKLTFCVAYEKYDFKFYSNHVFFPPFPFFSKTTGLFIRKRNISAKFQCYC